MTRDGAVLIPASIATLEELHELNLGIKQVRDYLEILIDKLPPPPPTIGVGAVSDTEYFFDNGESVGEKERTQI